MLRPSYYHATMPNFNSLSSCLTFLWSNTYVYFVMTSLFSIAVFEVSKHRTAKQLAPLDFSSKTDLE